MPSNNYKKKGPGFVEKGRPKENRDSKLKMHRTTARGDKRTDIHKIDSDKAYRPRKERGSRPKNIFPSDKLSDSGNFYDETLIKPKTTESEEPIFYQDFSEHRDDIGTTSAVAGRNAVKELLVSGRDIDKLFVLKGAREGSIVALIAEARGRGIPVIEVERGRLDTYSGGVNHQGVVAMAAERSYSTIDDVFRLAEEGGEHPLIVIADKIEDPHNLGALIRSAECAGAHGIIIPKRRACGLTPTVAKASAGALEHLAVAKVTNIAATIEELKKRGLWIFAAEVGGNEYYNADFNLPMALVLGSEGTGVSRLIKDKSDFIVSIPMYGKVNSLNVSAAAAVLLSEAARQRHSGDVAGFKQKSK